MEEETRGSAWRSALNWVAVYGGWAATSAAAVGTLFAVRGTLLMAYPVLAVNKWAMGLLDKWGLFALMLVTLVGILFSQHYLVGGYPGGPSLGKYPRRLVRVMAVEAAVFLPTVLVRLAL